MNKKTKTQIDKVMSNETLTKNLLINEILKANSELLNIQKNEFSHSLVLASFVAKSNDYFKSNECKEELTKLNVKYSNSTQFISELIGREERQVQRYKALAKIDAETLKEFTESNQAQSIQNCLKYASDKKKGIINLSVTKPVIDKSKTIKPVKFEAKNKVIAILLQECNEAEKRNKDITECIKYLKSLLPIKENKSKKAASIVA